MPLSIGMSLAVNNLSTISINGQICVFTIHFYDNTKPIRTVSSWQLDIKGDKIALKYSIVCCCSFLGQSSGEEKKNAVTWMRDSLDLLCNLMWHNSGAITQFMCFFAIFTWEIYVCIYFWTKVDYTNSLLILGSRAHINDGICSVEIFYDVISLIVEHDFYGLI